MTASPPPDERLAEMTDEQIETIAHECYCGRFHHRRHAVDEPPCVFCKAATALRRAPAMREDDPTERVEWQPIELAPREAGMEILGVRIAGDKMLREPFISFWSPTLSKFYCDPTHYILMPRRAALRAEPTAGGEK